jgi:hypothetical protein
MSLLLITYDLNKPGQDYTKLYATIKTAPKWWHHLDSTWIIYTPENPSSWFDKLKPSLDENDNLLIVDITKQPRQGWLSQKAWDWLNENNN